MGDKANKIRARARNHWTSNHGPFYVCDGGGGVEREGEGSGVGFGQCQGGGFGQLLGEKNKKSYVGHKREHRETKRE